MTGRKSHTPEDVRLLERTYDLELVRWETVGGEYLYDRMENGHPRTTLEDAGMMMRVPVFCRKKTAEKPKVVQGEWRDI